MFNKNNKKGFTLMELLIVVAIIAVLVAISIPVFTAQLEKARESTDIANERAAKAAAVVQYLTGDDTATSASTYYYDATNGKLVAKAPTTGYGKGTTKDAKIDPNGTVEKKDKVIQVGISTEGDVTLTWVAKGTTGN